MLTKIKNVTDADIAWLGNYQVRATSAQTRQFMLMEASIARATQLLMEPPIPLGWDLFFQNGDAYC